MRKFCHHIFLRSCVPWRWNLAACDIGPAHHSAAWR
jgi:hypothetical protein